MSGIRTALAAVLLAGSTVAALAQNETIKGPEDAKCRDEARDLVFSAPNPKRLSPFDLGAEIYHGCMRRLGAEGKPAPGR
ncbi:hypothetical protein SAMN05216360_102391 [Methylobacterium phyllostachyos]|uniref:PsiF repeat-containing protein n=1 Tax=Methylobacterium phyllostachyos TaxID=582672 RepID=A0A1G9U416_9HYPH|nr:hypothetical protein [Methylobacterium phyllostachyos]SDM54394.1 hypothetical protein SAMN05216360_102391 [Methylobacterium phyllostachyos]